MVCSIWKHIAVRKNGDGLANHPEHKVKRACTKWGIGRELYTAPRIWIRSDKCNIQRGQNGKLTCYDEFEVEHMEVSANRITYLSIRNASTGRTVFVWGQTAKRNDSAAKERPTAEQISRIEGLLAEIATRRNVSVDVVRESLMGAKSMASVGVTDAIRNAEQAAVAVGQLEHWLRGTQNGNA